MGDVYVKLDDAIAVVDAHYDEMWRCRQIHHAEGNEDSVGRLDARCRTASQIAQALRALPVSDGWEDMATCETYAEVFVWCECETSGKRWTTVAYKERSSGRWYSEDEGYVPAKGYRPLPAPPSE